MDLPPAHAAFLETERSHWAAAAAAGRLYFAISAEEPIGFAALGFVDGAPYLAQMSVRRAHMRRGVGTALLARAIDYSATYGELWLTTYVHLAWNQPYYQRFGFVAVDEQDCGDELQAALRSERQALPSPNNRTAMVFRHHHCHA
jgi:GNAT superfamily N-acetyltransferase